MPESCETDLTSLDLNLLPPSTISTTLTGSTISLYPFILFSSSFGLNLQNPDSLKLVLRGLDEKDIVRGNEEVEVMREIGESEMIQGGCAETFEGDDELIIHIRFTEILRVKSLLLGTGGGRTPESPRQVKIWVNRSEGINFSEVESTKSEQEFVLLEGMDGNIGSVEYPLRLSKFGNVREITLFFSNTRAGELSRLYYIGFLGESKQLKKETRTALSIGAETGVHKMVDSVRETKGSGLASVR